MESRGGGAARSGYSSHSVAYDYFRFLEKFGENESGTCTVLAAAILLGYYDNYVDEDFVPMQYEDGNGTTEAFHQLLNLYVYGTSPLGGILIRDAVPDINAYLTNQMVLATMVSEYTSQTSAINSMINNLASGAPVIASMGIDYGAAYNHTVLIYSVSYYNGDPTGTAAVTMHMGWHDSDDEGPYKAYVATAGWFYECGYLQYY